MSINIQQMKRSSDEIVPEGNENESKKSKNIKDVYTNEITNHLFNSNNNKNESLNDNKNELLNNNLDDEDDEDDLEDLDNLENILSSIANNKNIFNKIDNHCDANLLYKINLHLLKFNRCLVKRLNELKKKKECELNNKIFSLRVELKKKECELNSKIFSLRDELTKLDQIKFL